MCISRRCIVALLILYSILSFALEVMWRFEMEEYLTTSRPRFLWRHDVRAPRRGPDPFPREIHSSLLPMLHKYSDSSHPTNLVGHQEKPRVRSHPACIARLVRSRHWKLDLIFNQQTTSSASLGCTCCATRAAAMIHSIGSRPSESNALKSVPHDAECFAMPMIVHMLKIPSLVLLRIFSSICCLIAGCYHDHHCRWQRNTPWSTCAIRHCLR